MAVKGIQRVAATRTGRRFRIRVFIHLKDDLLKDLGTTPSK
jgi:hypothetical protein